jgi:hypothetical protein
VGGERRMIYLAALAILVAIVLACRLIIGWAFS